MFVLNGCYELNKRFIENHVSKFNPAKIDVFLIDSNFTGCLYCVDLIQDTSPA